MITRKTNKVFSTLIIAASLSGQAYASDEIGTVSVQYAPVSSSGVTTGCSLIYTGTFLDIIHKQGIPVALNGNISVNVFPEKKAVLLTYKLGLRDFTNKGLGDLYPPHFMFLKTSKHTTSKIKFVSYDSDIAGYRNYAVQLDKDALDVLEDMLAEQKVFIGYNLSKGGTDALVQLDLTVKHSNIVNGEMKRIHSNEAISQYADCLGELTKQL